METWPDPVLDGTLIASPVTGLFYYAPDRYRDGASAFRSRPEDFRLVADDDPFLDRLRVRLAAIGGDLPQSPGEYTELA